MVIELVTELVTELRNGLQFWRRNGSAIGATICAMELVSNLGDEFVFVLEWVIVGAMFDYECDVQVCFRIRMEVWI